MPIMAGGPWWLQPFFTKIVDRTAAPHRSGRPRRRHTAAEGYFTDKTSISKISTELGMIPHAGNPPWNDEAGG